VQRAAEVKSSADVNSKQEMLQRQKRFKVSYSGFLTLNDTAKTVTNWLFAYN